ncbi:hypothetical protein GCM10017044_26620 [Kordiimonas sediminis]|uniref:Uncharacterized protein n=1 Tax=Kordiimonas sediminis TaxID=1735581 RepID=A0A919EAE0_9PROT|nr:hypothetical protein [Kordiimonas sediminis]GHF29973.1 hypothetical protein GCM10017044_26620 [Kordiimonas sediminis]
MSEQINILDFMKYRDAAAEVNILCAELTAEECDIATRIARHLDKTLEEMVMELENVASCQQSDQLEPANDTIPPFFAFCVGLETIGDNLIPHLASVYKSACENHNIHLGKFPGLFESRAEAFIQYLKQIACVHGLAFDGGVREAGPAEQLALSGLEVHLRGRMAQAKEAFTA